MITKEELAIFEYELIKLMDECQKCVDPPVKSKIQEDIAWLKLAIFSTDSSEQLIEN